MVFAFYQALSEENFVAIGGLAGVAQVKRDVIVKRDSVILGVLDEVVVAFFGCVELWWLMDKVKLLIYFSFPPHACVTLLCMMNYAYGAVELLIIFF